VEVFSSIAVQPAVEVLLPRFIAETGIRPDFTWNTAPALIKRLQAGETADLLILNRAGMEQLEKGLRELKLEWIPSSGNFLAFELPKKNGQSAGEVYQKLLRQGVIVRPVAGYEMPDHLRVTVGTREENEIFLKALREALT